MFDNIWYWLGMITGVVLKIVVYVSLIWGIWQGISLHEVPYLPLILWMVYIIFTRIIFISNVITIALRRNDGLTQEDVIKLINITNFKNSIGLGPN